MNLEQLITTLMVELLQFIKDNPDFFDLDAKQTQTVFDRACLSAFSREYLLDSDMQQIFDDIGGLTKYLKHSVKLDNSNVLAQHLARFLCKQYNMAVISLDKSFANLDAAAQAEKIDHVFKSNNKVTLAVKDLFLQGNFDSLAKMFGTYLGNFEDFKNIIVQIPLDVDASLRRNMVTKFNDKFGELSLVNVQINQRIVGGLRVFVNGELTDLSWHRKIETLTKTN